MNSVSVLVTAAGNLPYPPEMAALPVRMKSDGWPDMRTKAGKRWAEMFREIEDKKINEWLARE